MIVGVEQGLDLAVGARPFSAAITASPDSGAPLSTSTRPSPVEKAVTLAPPASITARFPVSLVTGCCAFEQPREPTVRAHPRPRPSIRLFYLRRASRANCSRSPRWCRCCRRSDPVPDPPSAAASDAGWRWACAPAAPGAGRPASACRCRRRRSGSESGSCCAGC